MAPFSPASRAGLLRDAADHAQKATNQLISLLGRSDVSREQKRRLRCLAACSSLAAQGADRLMMELASVESTSGEKPAILSRAGGSDSASANW